MIDKTVETQAINAADKYSNDQGTSWLSRMSFEHGYLSGHASRDAEIAALQAKIAEAEARMPRWMTEKEGYWLEHEGWHVCGVHRIASGWLSLMCPPILPPEGK